MHILILPATRRFHFLHVFMNDFNKTEERHTIFQLWLHWHVSTV